MSIPALPPPWPTDPLGDPVWIANADPDSLRDAVARLTTRLTKLEQENAALEFAAESFGARRPAVEARLPVVSQSRDEHHRED